LIRRSKLLNRDVHQRDARLFLVIVEGAETEPAYFNALKLHELIPRHRVELQVYPPANHESSPGHLLALAKEKSSEIKLLDQDEVWIILDVDLRSGSTRQRQLHLFEQECRQRGWNIAISNPCFEVWYWLHLSDQLAAIDESCASVEVSLRQTLGSYSKKTPPAPCLEASALTLAIERAASLDADPRAPIPVTVGSRLYRLFHSIQAR